MDLYNKLIRIVFLLSSFTNLTYSQSTDYGSLSSLSLSKGLTPQMAVKLEQELRFTESMQVLDRSLSTLSMDYILFRKILKAEFYYDYLSQHQKFNYNINHRASAALITKLKIDAVDFELRLREQSTWRDPNGIDFKKQPNSVLRTRIECVYSSLKSSVKPYFSSEMTSPLDGDVYSLNGLRTITGAKCSVSTHSTVVLYMCCDQVVRKIDPINVFYGGVGWNYKM